MLIIHFIGLAMGLGTSFGFIFLEIAGSKIEKDERLKFKMNTLALSQMGFIGLALMIISGGLLMPPYWSALGSMPMLMAKLVLVLILVAVVGLIAVNERKAREADAETHIRKIGQLGALSTLTTLAIVVLAVLIFR